MNGLPASEDIALVGYDGIAMGQNIVPRLTTYSQDTFRIAREAFLLLTDAIENPDQHVPKRITVAGHLIEGETA